MVCVCMCVSCMQENGHDVLQDLPRTEYKQMLDLMRHAIVATDLAVYAVNIKRLSSNVTSQAFRLTNHDYWYAFINFYYSTLTAVLELNTHVFLYIVPPHYHSIPNHPDNTTQNNSAQKYLRCHYRPQTVAPNNVSILVCDIHLVLVKFIINCFLCIPTLQVRCHINVDDVSRHLCSVQALECHVEDSNVYVRGVLPSGNV